MTACVSGLAYRLEEGRIHGGLGFHAGPDDELERLIILFAGFESARQQNFDLLIGRLGAAARSSDWRRR